MRKIKFKLLTQTNLEVLSTSARTFGELKQDMKNVSALGTIDFGANQLIERETRVAYGTIDDAILPATDCIMFVTPLKTKSGAELSEMGYMELRSLGSKLNKEENAGIDLTGKRDDILPRVEAYFASQLADDDGEEYTVEEVVEVLEDAVYMLSKLANAPQKAEELLAIRVSLDELQQEAEALAALYKK